MKGKGMEETEREYNNRISLCRYLEALMKEYKDAHAREHILMSENVEKTARALEIRLEAMNEFRAQILAERGHFVTQDKYDAQHQALNVLLDAKIEVVEKDQAEQKAAVSNIKGRMSAIAAAITVGLIIVQMFLHFVVK